MVNITHVDVLGLAASIPYANELTALANASTDHVSFISYSDEFLNNVLGNNVTQQLVAETSWDAFHEAGVYNIETGLLYATSNFAGSLSNPINITAIDINRNNEITSIRYPNVSLANGGSAFYPVGSSPSSSEGQEIVFCDQGDPINPSKLTVVNPATNETRVLVDNFYGRNFTSLNDVEQHYHTGDLWFTDARYGYWQGFRPEPAIRPQVYRFEPKTGVVQAVADDFVAPNGLEFSPDFKHVYVSDTGFQTFPGAENATEPTSIYRFDVTADGKRLQNRQLFAYAARGLPDGIHTDTEGYVYSACGGGDGVNVWNPSGVLIGQFAVSGGSNNFAFVPGGMYIFNANKLFKITIKAEGRVVKRDFGLQAQKAYS